MFYLITERKLPRHLAVLLVLMGLMCLMTPARQAAKRIGVKSTAYGPSGVNPPRQPQSNPLTPIASSSDRKPEPDDATRMRLHEAYGKIPLSFELENGQRDSSERFVSRSSGFMISLSSTQASFAIPKSHLSSRHLPQRVSRRLDELPKDPPDLLRMNLVAANPQSRVAELVDLEGKTNYLIGNNPKAWRTNVATYSKVRFGNVYPGIDIAYYGKGRQLEYDFVVSPGANPKSIRLAFEGAYETGIADNGDLLLRTANTEFKQTKPVIYQMINERRTEVSGRYALKNDGEVGFEIGAYDASKSLVIDPAFVYSTYLGGGGDDIGYAVTVDSDGNTYVAGRTLSTNFPTVNPYRSTNSGLRDIFVTKLNSTGTTILYSTYIGGVGEDVAFAIAVNSSGEAYLTGQTNSTDFPIVVGALQPVYGGGIHDAFLVRLNSSGNALIASTYAGGNGDDVGTGVALDSSRNIYGIGYTTSTNLQTTVNSIQQFNAGGYDGFLLELNPAASSLVFATYAGGSGDDFGNAIAVDSSGYIYAIGDTSSTDLVTVNPLQSSNAGGFDAFLGKLTPSGTSIVFTTYAGGSGDDAAAAIAVDGSGNIYAVGFTNSASLPFIVNAVQPNKAALYDAFVAKLNSTGSTMLYATYLGGSGDDGGYGVAVDFAGNAIITGDTSSTNFPLMKPLRSTNAGGFDVFITKLSTTGSRILFSTYLGGTSNDTGFWVATDQIGTAYVTGVTTSTNFSTANPVQAASAGGFDAFVAKIATNSRARTGVFRPSTGELFLKNANSSGFADTYIIFGNPGDYPIAGDWNGDGIDSVGIYRNGVFYLRNSNSTGFADIVVAFGNPSDQPVVGDWNGDGTDTIGVYRNGTFILRNSNTAGAPDLVFTLGNPGDVAIAGDWNGDGIVSGGVFRPSNGIVYLKNSNTTGFADLAFVFGNAGDKPVAGDWDGDGIDTIGIYRNGFFYLSNSNTTGFADIVFVLGNDGDSPIAGNWNGSP